MKSVNDIKQLIRKFNVTTNATMDQGVRQDISNVVQRLKTTKSTVFQQNIWSTIMKTRITKLAAAAAVILIASVGIILLEKSATPLSAAEQIQEIIKTNEKYKGWIHTVHELYEANEPMIRPLGKVELHINTVDATSIRVRFEKDGQRRIRYESPRNGICAEYSSMANEIQIFDLAKTVAGDLSEMHAHLQSQLSIGSALLDFKKLTGREPYEIRTTKDGTYERFDIVFFKNGQEKTPATCSPTTCSATGCSPAQTFPTSATLWVDPNTKLILKIHSAMQDKTRVSTVTYGEPNISDIYDLGVPRKARVIDNRSTVDTKDVLDRLDNRIEAFGDYLAILTETPLKDDGTRDLDYCALNVLAQHGQTCLFNRYLVGADTYSKIQKPRSSVMETPETWPMVDVNSILEQLKGKLPREEFFIYDGNDLWSQWPLPESATKSSIKGFVDITKPGYDPPGRIWFGRRNEHGPRTKIRLLKKEDRPNQIGLHVEFDVGLRHQRVEQIYWLDPARDDMPTSRIERDYTRDGKTVETEFEWRYLDYSRLPDGRWYPTRWQTIRTDRKSRTTREYNLYIYPHIKLDKDWFTNPSETRKK